MEENRCKRKKRQSNSVITIKDKDTINELRRIQDELGLKHTSEVIRYLVRYWVKNELDSKIGYSGSSRHPQVREEIGRRC